MYLDLGRNGNFPTHRAGYVPRILTATNTSDAYRVSEIPEMTSLYDAFQQTAIAPLFYWQVGERIITLDDTA